ncbi:Na(+)-translocating NADH-quinone reductase subunit A [Ichthyobacterium seriolicida]|uniref:Na(+)-translocating NADH-quinone reductase subunit A n=1 Tax=Ichthyobacterium seriolicida TaxID=242600 RepID=A0A1J1DZD9_9FLAO|nr:Na(+)-translocating NADH-quinone reductase subunit A [Ichthyobacterium seriolicida]BAV95279.1 Na(+)-translocating NADH-quinone reductase subunit A [Ichthyobacterium seriolicida]
MFGEVRIKKGLNIKIQGASEKVYDSNCYESNKIALKPTDFHSVIPKLLVEVGDSVEVGSPIFCSKADSRIVFVSTVSGKVSSIVRGEKRKILEVIIESDHKRTQSKRDFDPISDISSEKAKEILLSSGLWPYIMQRPFDVIADPDSSPKSIFVSALDTCPLPNNYEFSLIKDVDNIQAGINVLKKFTDGNFYFSVDSDIINSIFSKLSGVKLTKVSGPHPSGDVGVQIHHIDPINKGEQVWVVNPQDLAIIGRFFLTGELSFERVVSICGTEVINPKYTKVISGSNLESFLPMFKEGNNRIISGNIFTGNTIKRDGFLSHYSNHITVIPEGDNYDFLGWLLPSSKKFFPLIRANNFSWLFPNKKYKLDTNTNGEERALVVTGDYEKVFPMDIYPLQLLKAFMTEDVELLEELGAYEVSPEDFALIEFICPSKINSQQIVREGLDLMKKELG